MNKIDQQIASATELISEGLSIISQIREDKPAPKSIDKNITVAIVVGHSNERRGASNPDTGMSEYIFNYKVAEDIASSLNDDESHNVNGIVVLRKTSLRALPNAVNATGAVLCLSLHCNAFNTKARGCETLYHHTSKQGKVLAQYVQHELVELMNSSDRGIKAKSSEDRGGYMLRETNMPCVIAEPFFIDEEEDYKLGMQYRDDGRLAGAYTRAILNMVNAIV